MTKVNNKLKEVLIDFYYLYISLLLLGKTYMVILLNIKIHKTWMIYSCSKKKFNDVFQVWLWKI